MGNILEIKDLSKNFKGLKAVDSVSFAVEEGGITGLIGSNGAGKTTVFNMISGVFPPTAGHIIYKNKEITGMKPYHYTSMGIARTFQIMKPLASMSVLDNVASGALYGRKKYKSVKEAKEYAEEILHFTGLYERKDWLPGEMGTPFKKRLELARALATDPDMLLLDEVMAGLNPTETDEAVELIRKINENGTTILLIEHVMRAVANLCQKVVVMHHGEKITEGTPEMVMNDPYVIDAMEAPAIRASSGGAFYLFLMNPAFTFMAVIGNQAGRSTSFASVCSYFGMENTGFVMEHWVLLSVLLQLAAGALLLWEAVQFLEPVKKKGKRKNKRMRHTF